MAESSLCCVLSVDLYTVLYSVTASRPYDYMRSMEYISYHVSGSVFCWFSSPAQTTIRTATADWIRHVFQETYHQIQMKYTLANNEIKTNRNPSHDDTSDLQSNFCFIVLPMLACRLSVGVNSTRMFKVGYVSVVTAAVSRLARRRVLVDI